MPRVQALAMQLNRDVQANSLVGRVMAIDLARESFLSGMPEELLAAYGKPYDEQILGILNDHATHDDWYRAHRETGLVPAVEATLARQPLWKRLVPTGKDNAYNNQLAQMESALGTYPMARDHSPFNPGDNIATSITYTTAASILITTAVSKFLSNEQSMDLPLIGMVSGTCGVILGAVIGVLCVNGIVETRNQLRWNASYLDNRYRAVRPTTIAPARAVGE